MCNVARLCAELIAVRYLVLPGEFIIIFVIFFFGCFTDDIVYKMSSQLICYGNSPVQ